jgi:hypothetical protein
MAVTRVFFLHVETALLALLVLGMWVRHRAALCRAFFAYALAILVTQSLLVISRGRVSSSSLYTFNQTTFAVLKFLTALEIWSRTFSSLPRARARVGLLLAAALLASMVAIIALPPGLTQWHAFVFLVEPRLQAGSLATFVILVSAISWYRIPFHPFHRAIVLGFAVYLSVHAFSMSMVGWLDDSRWARQRALLLEGTTYIATLGWWTWAAWRPLRQPSPVASRLHPWARSW